MSDSRVEKVKGEKGITLEYNGVRGSMLWWSRQLDMTPSTLYRRLIRTGWDLERACEKPVKASNRRKITYDGKSMSIRKWAEFLNIPIPTLEARFHRGWSVERALGTPAPVRKKGIEHQDRKSMAHARKSLSSQE